MEFDPTTQTHRPGTEVILDFIDEDGPRPFHVVTPGVVIFDHGDHVEVETDNGEVLILRHDEVEAR